MVRMPRKTSFDFHHFLFSAGLRGNTLRSQHDTHDGLRCQGNGQRQLADDVSRTGGDLHKNPA